MRLLATLLLLAASATAAPFRICRDARSGWPTYTNAEACDEVAMYTYTCDSVRGLPGCSPPATFALRNPAAPSALRVQVTFGGEVVRHGDVQWLWVAGGRTVFVTGRFWENPSPAGAAGRPAALAAPAVAARRVPEVASITIAGSRYSAPGYVFVAAELPAATRKVIVERGTCLCTSRPAWTITGTGGYSLFAIPADVRGQPNEQVFQVMLGSDDVQPYAGPYRLSDLRAATCAELHIDCDGAGVKRRAVRP